MHSIQNVAHSFNLTISFTHQVALNLRNTFDTANVFHISWWHHSIYDLKKN